MKFWVLLYYLFFLFIGGYRNYSFEYEAYASIMGFYNENIHLLIILLHTAALIVCAITIIFLENKRLHLLFFLITFALDLYFQNFIKFENSESLTHAIPLFIFVLALTEQHNKPEIFRQIVVACLCIGYTASALGKIQAGWLNADEAIVQKLFYSFDELMPNPIITKSFADKYLNSFIWHVGDYAVILFQFSAVFLLFSRRYLKPFLWLCAIFHLAVALFLQVSLFYPYIIFYGIILAAEHGETLNESAKSNKLRFRMIVLTLTVAAGCIYRFSIFEELSLPFFYYKDLYFTVFCTLLFFCFQAKYISQKKYGKLISEES